MKIKNKPQIQFLSDTHGIITTNEGKFLQSYNHIVVFKPIEGKIQIGKNWRYSSTTGRYRNKFLNENKKITEMKLKRGEYELNMQL